MVKRIVSLVGTFALLVGSAVLFGAAVLADSDPNVSPVVFDTCGTKAWTVPAGVTSATFVVSGAAGGAGIGGHAPGGRGGESTATLGVTPGQTFTIVVGCRGGNGALNTGGVGGTGDGTGGSGGGATNGAGGGGGGSSVSRGALPVIVAGGGGGGGGSSSGDESEGGSGGGANQNGANGEDGVCTPPAGGRGATTSAPGAGGTGPTNGSPGSGTDGGDGTVNGTQSTTGSGGGGGGYFGGGGGAASDNQGCGGGGGGSGFAVPEATGVSFVNGVRSGDGLVTITFTVAAPASSFSGAITFTG